MKKTILAAVGGTIVAATALTALVPATASAYPYHDRNWHHRHHPHRLICHTEWHHHHRVRVCHHG